MFSEGTKEIVINSMHARIPTNLVRRNTWVNLCIDVQSFANECFQPKPQANQALPNIYRCLEQVQIEGHLRVRKIFTCRAQIPCEFGDFITSEMTEVAEVEPLPKNLDFISSIQSINQVVNIERVH
jgi:hypothetical protein